MNPPAPTVVTMLSTAKWTWQRLTRWLLAFVIANGVAFWCLFFRLSSMEQQLVGTWEGSRDAGNGRTVKLFCDLRADRTAAIEFMSVPSQSGQPGPQRIRLKQPTWSVSNRHLIFDEPLSPWTRFQLLFYRIQAWLSGGTKGGFYRQIEGLGPIREVRSGSLEMGEWHMERVEARTAPN